MKTLDNQTLGSILRAARERRGLSLHDVANITNVAPEIWRDAERNDLTLWPDHLVTREGLSRYAVAVGLDSEGLVKEFERIFSAKPDRVSRLLHANPALVHELD